MASTRDDVFDALYRASPDPWGTRTRWYERRKREVLLAALPKERFGSAYEAGCGTGHLTRPLAARCRHLLASDASLEAVTIARASVADCANVTVEHQLVPDDWPRRAFDLVVLSELLYFIDGAGNEAIAIAARESIGNAGMVVACNWRARIEGRGHRGDEVHARFEAMLGLPRCFEYADADFVLSGWSLDAKSVATCEGLR